MLSIYVRSYIGDGNSHAYAQSTSRLGNVITYLGGCIHSVGHLCMFIYTRGATGHSIFSMRISMDNYCMGVI